MVKFLTEKFRAVITDNLKDKLLEYYAKDEKVSVEQATEWYGGEELEEMCNRVSGKEVDMIKWICGYNCDYFEAINNNYVIPREMFIIKTAEVAK